LSDLLRIRWVAHKGSDRGREFRIRILIKRLGIDAVLTIPPSPDPLNVAILSPSCEVLIPIDPCFAALAVFRALEDLVRAVSGFRSEFTDAGH